MSHSAHRSLLQLSLIAALVASVTSNPISAATLQWNKTSLDLFGDSIGVAVSPSGVFFASDGFAIDRSVDFGETWREATPFASFAGGAIAYAPTDMNTMIAGRSHGLLKSVDGGANWFELTDLHAGGAARAIAFDPHDELTVYANGRYGWGLYRSRNGGATWDNPWSSREIYALAVDPFNSQTLYAGTYKYYNNDQGGVSKSIDGGTNWTQVFDDAQVATLVIHPDDSRILFAGTHDQGIFRSDDTGATWRKVSGDDIVAPVTAIRVHPRFHNFLFASTAVQGLFYSDDRGETWSTLNQGLTDYNLVAMDMQREAPYALFAATVGGNGFWAIPRLVAGDTDFDGDVDLEDLNAVRNNFDAQGTRLAGDTNDDGRVDLVDLNEVRNHFGRLADGGISVPEPQSSIIAALLGTSAIGIAANRLISSRRLTRQQHSIH